jgi:hypothetical protein
LIITGTYDIPTNLDAATTLILKEIWENGPKDNERVRQRDYYHPGGIHSILEKGRRIHILVKFRGTLWPL